MRKVVMSLLALALAACAEQPLPTTGATPSGTGAAVPTGGAPVLPAGYGVAPMANRLEDPRAVLFDPAGRPLVLEGAPARVSRVEPDGSLTPLAQGGGNGPWTGAAMANGRLFVAESGGPLGGRILEIKADGSVVPLAARLPGDGLVGPLAAGPDGWLHVGIASAAATGGGTDIPCQDQRVGGRQVKGRVPCTGAVLRLRPGDARPEIHSWGWRAPEALAFAADGRLMVADRAQAGSTLHQAVAGVWYGTPDSQLAAADPAAVDFPNPPPAPLASIDRPAAAVAATDRQSFGGPDEVFVALTEPGVIAFTAVAGGTPTPFAANLRRPQALAFSPDGNQLWVADAGTGTLWRITPYPTPAALRLPPVPPSATYLPNQWRHYAWTIRAWADGAKG